MGAGDGMTDNPPAFPACNEANMNGTMGMNLRDYFAVQILIAAANQEDKPLDLKDRSYKEALSDYWEAVASAAYIAADAMLKARGEAND